MLKGGTQFYAKGMFNFSTVHLIFLLNKLSKKIKKKFCVVIKAFYLFL